MSDEPPKPAEAAPAAAAKSPKLLLALVGLNLALSGFAVFRLMTAAPHAPAAAKHAEEEEAPAEAPKDEITGPVLALDPFVVNLDEPGQSRYLKVTFQLELATPNAEAALTKNKQLVRDTILSHLSGLRLADTLGAEAKDKIRIEILEKLEKVIGERRVRRMFFQEFVVQ